jgi:glycosyltransferase involved in cell wall biosynthesis
MDQLSQFKGAPETLLEREQTLLRTADIVFAGGPKLGNEKRKYNPNTFTYGCGVDAEHFGITMRPATSLPGDIANLPKPVLGFFGVIDERMDYELLAELADAFPGGTVAMIGPWAKVNPAEFPKRQNLHFLGGRDYAELPNYAAAFNACLVPFALNSATEYLNPTKILEYLATGRPVVSTAIEDVVLQFSDTVKIGCDHAGFIRQCQEVVAMPDERNLARGLDIARQNTWVKVVANLERHIADFLASGEMSSAAIA